MEKFRRNREITFNILNGKNRFSGCDGADNRDIDKLPSGKVKIVINDLNGSRLGRVTSYVSVLLQGLKMRVNRRSGLKMNSLTNLPDGRWISPIKDGFLDKF